MHYIYNANVRHDNEHRHATHHQDTFEHPVDVMTRKNSLSPPGSPQKPYDHKGPIAGMSSGLD